MEQPAINTVRTLSSDEVQAAKSGPLGTDGRGTADLEEPGDASHPLDTI